MSFFDIIFDMGFCIDKFVGGPNASPVWDVCSITAQIAHGINTTNLGRSCRRAMVFTALVTDASSKKLLGSYLGVGGR